MAQYQEDFVVGTKIKIRDRAVLERFTRDWKYHHPLQPEQLAFAGQVTTVKQVGYYHGGDVLYWLDAVPGTWHEVCIEAAPSPAV